MELDDAPLISAPAPGESDELIKRATAGRAELEALRARIRAMDATIRVSQSTSRPQVGLQAGYDLANPNPRILPLTGDWKDHRDCHIKPDLVLIYRKPDDALLQLVRLGSHSALGL